MPLISVPVAASGDDGFWDSDGGFDSGLTNAIMGRTSTGTIRRSFFRFQNVEIPTGQIIFTARIRFISATNNSSSPQFTIVGEDADDPAAVTSASDANGRTRTTASVAWSGLPAWSQGNDYVTPNIAAVIQEIVDRGGWAENNAIQLFVEGDPASNGTARSAATFDHSTFDAPVLEIFYGSTQFETGWVDFSSFAGNGAWLSGSSAMRPWSDPGNAAASDDSYAIRSNQSSTNSSAVLSATNAGIDLPDDAEILGIEVRTEAKYNAANGANIVFAGLTKNGTSLAGSQKFLAQSITDTDTYYTFGSDSDLWGTTWDAADIEGSGFGWGFNVNGSGGNTNVECDHMQIRVHYVSTADLLRVADVSVALQAIGIERNASVSAALLAESSRDASVSAALTALGLTRTADVSTALMAESSRQADVATVLQALGIERDADVASALKLTDIARDAGVMAALNFGGNRDADVLISLLAELSRDAGVTIALLSLLNQMRDAGVSVALQQLGLQRDAGVSIALNFAEFTGERTAGVMIALMLTPQPARSRTPHPPRFSIVLRGPLQSDGRLVNTLGLPPEVALSFSSELPGGWAKASAGIVREEMRRILTATRLQEMLLPDPVGVPAFGHLAIHDDGGVGLVWEGRIATRARTGGEIRGLSGLGYGITGLKDRVIAEGAGPVRTPEVVREVVSGYAPLIEVLDVADPHVQRDRAEFGGMSPYQALEQLAETGCGTCPGWTWTVYNRRLAFFPLMPPAISEYHVPVDETVTWEDDNESVYTAIELHYTDLEGVRRSTGVIRDEIAIDRFGVERVLSLSGGTLSDSAAAAFARSELLRRSVERVSAQIERTWERGLETSLGGVRPIWAVRAGEWVRAGDEGPQAITQVSYDQVTGRGTVTLGQPVSTDQQAVWRRLVEAETAERSGRNVVTRSAGG